MTSRSSLPTRRGTAAVAVDEAALPSGGHSAFEEQTRGDKSEARAQLEKYSREIENTSVQKGPFCTDCAPGPNLLGGVEEMER